MVNALKVDEAQQIVYGWAGQYLDEHGRLLEDLQGDMIDPAEVERAAYQYVLEKRESGVMHEGKTVGHIVASLVTTPDVVKAFFGDVKVPVGWLIGVKYPDKEVFKKVVSGELAMFSIQGNADRVEDNGQVEGHVQKEPRLEGYLPVRETIARLLEAFS